MRIGVILVIAMRLYAKLCERMRPYAMVFKLCTKAKQNANKALSKYYQNANKINTC